MSYPKRDLSEAYLSRLVVESQSYTVLSRFLHPIQNTCLQATTHNVLFQLPADRI